MLNCFGWACIGRQREHAVPSFSTSNRTTSTTRCPSLMIFFWETIMDEIRWFIAHVGSVIKMELIVICFFLGYSVIHSWSRNNNCQILQKASRFFLSILKLILPRHLFKILYSSLGLVSVNSSLQDYVLHKCSVQPSVIIQNISLSQVSALRLSCTTGPIHGINQKL